MKPISLKSMLLCLSKLTCEGPALGALDDELFSLSLIMLSISGGGSRTVDMEQRSEELSGRSTSRTL